MSSQISLAGSVTVNEGTSRSPTAMTFTVTRTGDVSGAASVSYSVVGMGSAAASYGDFKAGVLPTGTVNFAAGESSKTITIGVVGDAAVENGETFLLTLSRPAGGATLGTASATGTIVNDDHATPVLGVNVFNGSSLGVQGSSGTDRYGSVDPSGIAYNPATGSFFVVDAEIDEGPFYGSTNLLEFRGSAQRVSGSALTSFTKEPTGVAVWVAPDGSQRLFITDDNAQRVFQVDAANPTTVISSFSTLSFGAVDAEDISINPSNGNLFILSENDRRIYEVTQTGKLVSAVYLPSTFAPISDPNAQDAGVEALAYDSVRDVFYVAGGFSTDIFVISRAGEIVETINVLEHYPNTNGLRVYAKGLTLGPASDGSGKLSLWVADYGLDQVADGRLIEIKFDQPWQSATPPVRTLSGTSSSETLAATSDESWTINGSGGNDTIVGRGGNDTLSGGTGNDQIRAGGGDDLIRVSGTGHGYDAIDGGDGVDRIEAGAKGTVIGLTSIQNVEVISASGFSSVSISGSSNSDLLDFTNVTLFGIGSINGGSGNDTIYGSQGKDVIRGGSGADTLFGNGGADVFDFNSASESGAAAPDWIMDFQAGLDKIDLKGVDANSLASENQAFKFVGTAAFSGQAGQLRVDATSSTRTIVQGDVNGDGVADFAIILNGYVQLAAGDFYL